MTARFSAPVHTGPGAHPASYTMGAGSFPWVKRPGRGADHPPSSSAEVKVGLEQCNYSPCGPSWPVIGANSTFTKVIFVEYNTGDLLFFCSFFSLILFDIYWTLYFCIYLSLCMHLERNALVVEAKIIYRRRHYREA